jgi:hypothetical protein
LLKTSKASKIFVVMLLTAALLMPIVSLNNAKAQGQATVDVISSVGGTTTPSGDNNTYADGTVVTLIATPGNGFLFQYWAIVTSAGGTQDSNNPTTLNVTGGVTYAVQAVFQPISFIPPATQSTSATNAIVVVLSSVGGTTTPVAGTYALANAENLSLTATPTSGFRFDHWVIGGSPLNHGAYSFTDTPTDNPYNVNHGYGHTDTYQPVFVPTNAVPEFSSIATIAMALVLVAIAFGTYAYKRKIK